MKETITGMIDDLSIIDSGLPIGIDAIVSAVPCHQFNHVSFYHLLVIIIFINR